MVCSLIRPGHHCELLGLLSLKTLFSSSYSLFLSLIFYSMVSFFFFLAYLGFHLVFGGSGVLSQGADIFFWFYWETLLLIQILAHYVVHGWEMALHSL